MASWPENWRLFDRGRRPCGLILSALQGNSDVPFVELTLEKACASSEQRVQGTNANNVLHLIWFKNLLQRLGQQLKRAMCRVAGSLLFVPSAI